MKENNDNMEGKILACAEVLFLKKGYNLTSMTEIAKAAGCTQALVHYYFRTKENLFMKVFSETIDLFVESIVMEDDDSLPFADMLSVRVSRLFDLMAVNRRLPYILMSELVNNPEHTRSLKDYIVQACSEATVRFEERIRKEIESGGIREVSATDLTLDIFSLVVPFFIMLPFLEEMGLVNSETVGTFMDDRKNEIMKTLIGGLRV